MKAKIQSKQEVAKDTLLVVYDLLGQEVTFKPGQYFFVTLINPPYPDERGNKRHFSIISTPNQKGILTMATRLRDSGFKKSLRELPVGMEVEVGPIAGVFSLPDDPSRPLVFISGGIGITPFMSMLSYIKEQKLNYKITLIYSNRDRTSGVFLDQLQSLTQALPNFKLILTMTEDPTWEGEKRKVDAAFIKDYIRNLNESLYFVVGPPPMVEAIEKALKEAGVLPENIKIENFTGY